MKLSLNWLNDYIKHGLSPENLAERLTMAGHEVKNIERVGGDEVFEIEITPNRPDCLNTLGLAREVSAITQKPLKFPKRSSLKLPKSTCSITIESKEDCSRYVGVVIEGVTIGKSANFIAERLASVGLRTINNAVDVTNFGLFENGQPLHVFDYDKLVGGKIIVRRAKAGEKIVTLDGVERTLNPSILVIADEQRPVAIAGIMGGKDTEVTPQTQRILLESAHFDPILIRRAGRSLGLTSDSAYRFERGVNVLTVDQWAERATGLLLEQCGGKMTQRRDVFVKKPVLKKGLAISLLQLNSFLGASLSEKQMKAILAKLEFQVRLKGKSRFQVVPPAFRNDIKGEVDIAEEVARVIGYDRLPSSLPQIKPSAVSCSPKFILKRKLRRTLTALGLCEAISYSLVSKIAIEKSFGSDEQAVKVKNPLSLDQEYLRPFLLASLLPVVSLNFNRAQRDLQLFELGKVYSYEGEKDVLGILLSGQRSNDWRESQKHPADFFDLKGLVMRSLEAMGVAGIEIVQLDHPQFSAGMCAGMVAGKATIGVFGKVHKNILKNWDLKCEDVYFAQLDIELLARQTTVLKHFKPLAEFPAMTRDVSLAVKQDISYGQVETLIHRCHAQYLTGIRFLEQYMGDKIPAGQKGLVFSLIYQAADRTLTEKDIALPHEQILKTLTQELGATIR